MKHNDDSIGCSRAFSRIESRGTAPHKYRSGAVVTPLGIVSVYSQGGTDPMTRLDVAYESRVYMRRWRRAFSDRGIVTKARQFIEEITGNAP